MRKLYYEDCHLAEFTATITGCTETEKGWLVTLDTTAFYPEGGGQACDTGTLGGMNVLDVRERGADIFHLCDGPLEIGTAVTGRIDWDRRFDLMQQHTGEHIISGLLHRKFGCHNTGFHVGQDVMEVDFDCLPSAAELAEVERQANEAIWADLPLKCWIPSPEELPNVTYRTKRPLPWPVRIVQVPGYDSCACCGVHVARTGEVGLIKILSSVKFHGGIRLEMVCGGRAYDYMARIFEENRAVSQAFSAPMTATGTAARKMNDALAAEKFRSSGLLGRVFDGIARDYSSRENVIHFEDGLEPGQVRALADRIAGVVSGYCAVFSGSGENYSYCLAAREGDLRQLNKEMTGKLSGRGGGKPNFQQGNVRASKEEILAFFAERMRQAEI